MKKLKIALLVMAVVLIATPAASMAQLQLRTIMNGLNDRMKSIVDAINREDFKTIEENALRVADHEKPPITERLKILGFLKRKSPELKAFDDKVHESANELAESAKKKNMDAVITNFAQVQKACIACHTKFKTQIVEHFYKQEKK